MAGVIGLRGPDIEKRERLAVLPVTWEDTDRPYVRPDTGLPVLTMTDGDYDVRRHVFGFSKRFSSFNARDDKLESGKMWSRMYGKSHGVAPVSYILEWSDLGEGKRPYRIERADGAAMMVPALVGGSWDHKGEPAFALVTREPSPFVAVFHDRMIAQLADDQLDVWLVPEDHGPGAVRECIRCPTDDELVAYPLAHDAGKARHDDPDALAAVGDAITWTDVKDRAQKPGSRQSTL